MVVNKYNAWAIREELERYARDGAWNKVRRKMAEVATSTAPMDGELWAAVVLARHKKGDGSLLNIVLKKIPPNRDDVTDSVNLLALPSALQSTERYSQTPLHLAIERNHSVGTLQDSSVPNNPHNPLKVIDRYKEMPLIKAAWGGGTAIPYPTTIPLCITSLSPSFSIHFIRCKRPQKKTKEYLFKMTTMHHFHFYCCWWWLGAWCSLLLCTGTTSYTSTSKKYGCMAAFLPTSTTTTTTRTASYNRQKLMSLPRRQPLRHVVKTKMSLYATKSSSSIKHLGIVGGGLAGLATTYHALLQQQQQQVAQDTNVSHSTAVQKITIWDKHPLGTGGASAVAGG
jgi:hypothetical protein